VAAIEEFEVAWAAAGRADDATLFQAGSLSKSVTSAVALELVERGALDLDSGIGGRLQSLRLQVAVGGATLGDLLGHTSGANVPFYPGYPQDRPVPTLEQSLRGLAPATTPAVNLDAKAVGRFGYSGGGYAVFSS